MARHETKKEEFAGLTAQQANKRLFEYGENILQTGKKRNAIKLFLGQFKDLMVIILLVATVLSVFMGEAVEALTIVLIVLVNAILGFLQEYRTEKTLEALKNLAAPHARVIRDGKRLEVPTAELVPEDLILLEAGDRVPADAKIVQAAALQADEALLSGESLPVEKEIAFAGENSVIPHQAMVYMGTNIVKGNCKAIVLHTGMRTEMGKIAGLLTEIEEKQTPLQEKLDGLSKYLAIGCIGICAIVAVTGILRGEPVFDMILTGISLSVAAIPEGLPAVVTIALALAVSRMLGRNALIRKLHAVETMGCASVICSDKTGTLTENCMTVQEIFTVEQQLSLADSGGGKRVAAQPDVRLLLDIAVLCNNAKLEEAEHEFFSRKVQKKRQATGDPTEIALLAMAEQLHVTEKTAGASYTRVDELPFDSIRKCMSVVVRDRSGTRYLLTKGAPDLILEKCTQLRQNSEEIPLTHALRCRMETANEELAHKALRVLAFAYRVLTAQEIAPQEEELTFVGLAGMLDPPRKEALAAVQKCRRAGIKTVMITGDHQLTAAAIASKLTILQQGDLVLTGDEIDHMKDAEFDSAVGKTTVFARVSPTHKLKIVRALKKQGNIVAMTGDGVNDAPAVKEADIGVSMGISGTDVTKEAASVILLDDNFATLVAAIEEGRVIYRNIRKFIRYLLSCNIGEVLTMFLGMLMGMPVVLLPIQILLINLATDGLPAIALGLEPAECDVMELPPRGKEESIFSDGLLATIMFRGCLIGLTTIAVFSSFMREFGSLELARTGAFATLVITQLIHVFECKSEEHGLFRINPFNNKKLILAVIVSAAVLWAAIYVPFFNPIFQTVPLGAHHLATMFAYVMFAPVLSSFLMLTKRKKRKIVAPPRH